MMMKDQIPLVRELGKRQGLTLACSDPRLFSLVIILGIYVFVSHQFALEKYDRERSDPACGIRQEARPDPRLLA
jgi:hypothetical protein